MMTVMERLKAAGYDIDHAEHLYGDGRAECEDIHIRITKGSDRSGPLQIVRARAVVEWSDGTKRPYPEGWDGESKGLCVTAYIREGAEKNAG